MRITLITQNEPFYLSNSLKYLFENLPSNCQVVSCVLTKASPFGKKKKYIEKIVDSFKIFGLKFFLFYSFKYIYSKLLGISVKKLLRNKQVKTLELSGDINSKVNVDMIQKDLPDLLISILGNQIFKSQIFNLAPLGCLNLHTALLPKYRGLMPSFWVLKNNENKTGVSVFFVDKGIDSGPIIVQKEIEIKSKTQAGLIKETKLLGMKAIIKAIELIKNDNVKLIPNPDDVSTYFSFPIREDVIEFKKAGKKFF